MDGSQRKKYWANKTFREAVFFFAVSAALIVYSFVKHYAGVRIEWKMSPYLFPILVSVFLLLLSVRLFAQARREANARDGGAAREKAYFSLRNFLATLAIVLLYGLSMRYVPFGIATAAMLAAMLLLLGERSWKRIALVSILTSGAIWAVFDLGLKVNLP